MKPKKADTVREKLEQELRDAMKEVDEKGLLFLLRQAQVLISNARIAQIQEQEEKPAKAGKPGRAAVAPPKPLVSIEDPKNGKAIFLNLGSARKILAPEEMKRIVRICYAAESKSEALRALFAVLVKERKDILTDAGITTPDHRLLNDLFSAVRGAYRLQDG